MSTNFIFSCCNGQELVDTDQSNKSISRNIISKNKTYTSLNSPKASLKSLSFQRNANSIRSSKNNNIHLASTVDIGHLSQSKNLTSRQNFNLVRVQKSLQPITIINQRREPTIPSIALIKERAIHFSYKNPQKQIIPKQKILPSSLQTKQLFIEIPKPTISFADKQKQIDSQKILKLQNTIKQEGKQKNAAQTKKHMNHIPMLNPNKYILGGSKFTILSQQEMEQMGLNQSQLQMQQSNIILNVFNPTKSQMKCWSLKPSMANIPERNSQTIIKEAQYKN